MDTMAQMDPSQDGHPGWDGYLGREHLSWDGHLGGEGHLSWDRHLSGMDSPAGTETSPNTASTPVSPWHRVPVMPVTFAGGQRGLPRTPALQLSPWWPMSGGSRRSSWQRGCDRDPADPGAAGGDTGAERDAGDTDKARPSSVPGEVGRGQRGDASQRWAVYLPLPPARRRRSLAAGCVPQFPQPAPFCPRRLRKEG